MKNDLYRVPLNILLADDEPEDRNFFDRALSEIPIATKLSKVRNGFQLMKYLDENSARLPDILFLDLSMPFKTGYECLAEIKENKKLKALTVVMLTASFTRGTDLEDYLKNTLCRMGAADYIRKTGNIEELKKIIQQKLTGILKNH